MSADDRKPHRSAGHGGAASDGRRSAAGRGSSRSSARPPQRGTGRGAGRGPDAAAHGGGAVSALGQQVMRALQGVLASDRPADLALRDFFHATPALGRRDRAVVAELVFDVLRNRRLYMHRAQSGNGPLERRLVLQAQDRVDLTGTGTLKPPLPPDPAEREWLERIAVIPAALPPAIRYSVPDWLYDTLVTEQGAEGAEAIASSLLRPAPLDLRVNTLKTDPDAAIAALAADGIEAQRWPGASTALRVRNKPALERSAAFVDGRVEVQDGGSQLLAFAVAPRRGQTIIDFCAGAGGKTLALAALLRGSGQVYACDVSAARLAKLRPRLARAGATNVQPMAIDSENDPKLARLAGRADLVLVDAPCSGTGTLRRNPDLKWRIDPAEIERLQTLQRAILQAAARLVKPGGALVYATCSLLSAENEQVAQSFGAANPDWVVEPIAPLIERASTDGHGQGEPGSDSPWMVLRPDRDDCDGFFAARWQRPRAK